ncbi:hypothetical protein P152DRAFT_38819 [Eremomyces bilateralis CBS 781.70]|uniref:Uncharacterized protein n=1 Tax=Eremomyces bilateralis CBS 781.70 TaxID=1392243 RepID=A0A6G1G2B6_9PEZI|nr:uncharacterized protein P152DRAFT_38819 [Eremomyces bilateralis CBS 781.70]KAF1811949.1 hypothetical protein P152DRAFT_38819 [Eremomyces bilateralis CBS 781.70]
MAIRSTPAEPRSEPPVEAPQIETDNVPAYLEEPLQLILQCLRKRSESPLSSVQVLSHALPSPDKTGHSFPAVLNALVSVLHGKEIRWINVFHAVHGQFRIADLPPGPPATPGPAIGGDDYFATRVFNSAVTVTDLQANTTIAPGRVSARRSASGNSNQPAALTAQARGPQPIVQPGTVNVALIERYIPPSSRAEYQDMFDPDGRSIICDRLAELSNDSGVLVLIYPTRDGATTFMNRYLKPLLDPLLRSLTVLNSFTADLAESIGDMDCGERMLCYQDSRFWMSGMCAALSKEGDSTYEMAYTGFTEVCPDRSLWAGRWWAGQEKPRIREMVQKYFREHHLRSESSGTVALSSSVAATSSRTPNTRTSAEIVEKIINGVVNNPYGDEKGEPLDSIEVGIFVIIKSRK